MAKTVEVLDTSLRDGDQTPGYNFRSRVKPRIGKYLLDMLNVDSIEIATAGADQYELEAAKELVEWAKEKDYLGRLEVLLRLNSDDFSWVMDSGVRVVNLLGKGSLEQLAKIEKSGNDRNNESNHKRKISNMMRLAKGSGEDFTVNLYLEDWSTGIQHSNDYVLRMVEFARQKGINRVMLPDTRGILSPEQAFKYVGEMVKEFPDVTFDFHAHHDYGQAVWASVAAVKAGAKRVHATVNGMGERAGNADISNLVAVLHDFTDYKVGVVEKYLGDASKLVESMSGLRVPPNRPVIGKNAYENGCGVHDHGGKAYTNGITMDPKRFGVATQITPAIGKNAGRSSVKAALGYLGLSLPNKQVTELWHRVRDGQKPKVTYDEIRLLVADIQDTPETSKVELVSCVPVSAIDYARGESNQAPGMYVKMNINGIVYEHTGFGDGFYSAFMDAVEKIYERRGVKLPVLHDSWERIPQDGTTSSIIEKNHTWQRPDGTMVTTVGVSGDELRARIEASMKMLRLNGYEPKVPKE